MILEYEPRPPWAGDTVWTIIRDNSGVPTGMMEGKVLRLSIDYRFLTVVPPAFYPTALSKDIESTSNFFKLLGAVLSKEKTDDTVDKISDTEVSDCDRVQYTYTPICDCFFSREECENALNNDAFRKGIIPGDEIWVVVRDDSDHPSFADNYYVLSTTNSIVFVTDVIDPESPFSLDYHIQDMLSYSHGGKHVPQICVFRLSDCYKSEDDAWTNLELELIRLKRYEKDGNR